MRHGRKADKGGKGWMGYWGGSGLALKLGLRWEYGMRHGHGRQYLRKTVGHWRLAVLVGSFERKLC